MPFRSTITTPEELALLVEALEQAWSEIAPGVEQDRAPSERERLARIIATVWSAELAADLVSLSLERFHESASSPDGTGRESANDP